MTERDANNNSDQQSRRFGNEMGAGSPDASNPLQSEARQLLSSVGSAMLSASRRMPGQVAFEDPYTPSTTVTPPRSDSSSGSNDAFKSALAKMIERNARRAKEDTHQDRDGVKPKPDDSHKPRPDGELKNPKAQEFVDLVNKRRRVKGLPELEVDTSRAGSAERNNQEMDKAGRSGHFAGRDKKEIAFHGPRSPEEAMKGFLESTGHRIRIDDPKVTKIYVAQTGNNYTAQFFA